MTVAFVFPGQGSQTVGMGKALATNFPVAAQVFAEVDQALGDQLSATVFEGPAGDWGARARRIVETEVYPALRRQADAMRARNRC